MVVAIELEVASLPTQLRISLSASSTFSSLLDIRCPPPAAYSTLRPVEKMSMSLQFLDPGRVTKMSHTDLCTIRGLGT